MQIFSHKLPIFIAVHILASCTIEERERVAPPTNFTDDFKVNDQDASSNVKKTPDESLDDIELFLRAAESGDLETLKEILSEQDDPSEFVMQTDEAGESAMIKAIRSGYTEIISFLFDLQPGLKDLADNEGMTPIDYANSYLMKIDPTAAAEIVAILSEAEIDPEILNSKLVDLMNGFDTTLEKVSAILAEGASPDSMDKSIEGIPIPVIFLAMGIKAADTSSVSLRGTPDFALTKLLVDSGADLSVTVLYGRGSRMVKVTPFELINRRRESRAFQSPSHEDWLRILEPKE